MLPGPTGGRVALPVWPPARRRAVEFVIAQGRWRGYRGAMQDAEPPLALGARSTDVVRKAAQWAAAAPTLKARRATVWLDRDAEATPGQRAEAATILRTLGIAHVEGVAAASQPDVFLDDLLAIARRAGTVQVRRAPPWMPAHAVRLDDRGVAAIWYAALEWAESNGEAALRQALDARADYRRLLAGAPAETNDALGLRWDLTHAPAPGTSRLTLIATRNCQLRCTYCMVKLWDEDSTEHHLDRAVDLLFSAAGDSVRMQFYGGEPLLRPDLVRRGIARARACEGRTGKRLAIILITNGIAVDTDIATFLRAHDVEVLLSLDGPPSETNTRRLAWRGKAAYVAAHHDTHATALRALSCLQAAGTRHHVILVVDPRNAESARASFAHVVSLGVRTAQICYAMGQPWGADATDLLCDAFEQIWREHRSRIEAGELTWVNLWRNEPILVDTALQVETDGNIAFMNECMFEKHKVARNYPIANVHDNVQMSELGGTPFHDYWLLTRIYGDRSPAWRDTMLDNIALGRALRKRLADVVGVLPQAGET